MPDEMLTFRTVTDVLFLKKKKKLQNRDKDEIEINILFHLKSSSHFYINTM